MSETIGLGQLLSRLLASSRWFPGMEEVGLDEVLWESGDGSDEVRVLPR